MTKIIRIPPREPSSPRPCKRRLPPVLLNDGWWLGDFTLLPAGAFSKARRGGRPGAADGGKKSATIIPFRPR